MTFVATVAMWLVAVSGFNAVFATKGWVLPVLLAAVLPLVVERSLVEVRRRHRSWSPRASRAGAIAVHVVLFLAVLGWTLYPESTFLGLPTPGTIAALWNGFGSGMRLARETVPPIESAPPFVAIATAAVWWCAAASGAGQWTSTSAALSTTPAITIYVAARILSQGGPGALPVWLLVVCVVWTIVANDYTRRGVSWNRVLVPGALCSIVALAGTLLAPKLPFYGSHAALDFRNEVGNVISDDNPFVDIKPRLVDLSPKVNFSVEATQRSYWRLTALDAFDGNRWSASGSPPSLPDAPSSRTARMIQEVHITDLRSLWLPAAAFPQSPPQTTTIDEATGSVVVSDHTRNDITYEVISAVPQFDADKLRKVGPADAGSRAVSHYLQHPSPSPDVEQWLDETVAGAHGPYEQAVAIESRLHTFRYDLNVSPGHDEDELRRFLLETQAGYCEQFAASMATLARDLGIPSRVAVGYLGGEAVRLGNGGRTVFEVRGSDSHAWPELWFEGWGWVQFDPTPRGDAVPREQPPTSAVAPPATSQVPGEVTTAPPTTAAQPEGGDTDAGAPPRAPSPPWVRLLVAVAAVVAVVVALVLALVGVKAWRRRRRLGRGSAGSWDEGLDLLRDLDVALAPGASPEEVRASAGRAGVDLGALTDAYVSDTYGPPETERTVGADAAAPRAVIAARRRLRHESPRRWLRAEVSTRSLRPRRPTRAGSGGGSRRR
ncbi:MAG: transglutaminaseTgpA domain-containing protein [Acidimicrobiia bacterium]